MRWRACWRRFWFLLRMRFGRICRRPPTHCRRFIWPLYRRQAMRIARRAAYRRWAHLFGYRDAVLAELEDARVAKVIGSSLEARVEISAGSHAFETLAAHRDDLRYLFIVSEVELGEPHADLAAERSRDKCDACPWTKMRALLELFDARRRVVALSDCLRTLC